MSGMFWKQSAVAAAFSIFIGCLPPAAQAGDIRIPLPSKTEATPVQRLNREGVEAIRKHQYEKAKTLFYRAYVLDPDDPFTLNNLGYAAEIEGHVDRAERFYELALEQPTKAIVSQASATQAQGKPADSIIAGVDTTAMEVNRANVQAIQMMSQGRAAEAELLLQKSLTVDPQNAFTLNNLGVAKEMEGELVDSLHYYTMAAATRSTEPATVTLNSSWRGKPIAEMAVNNAERVRRQMQQPETPEQRVARLNLRGVSALNRNDPDDARKYFRQAYAIDPNNAFTLNNLGYLFEMDGDRETAESYYEQAEDAQQSGARVGYATNRDAEGLPLSRVADNSDQKVGALMTQQQEARRRSQKPIELMRRNGQPVGAEKTPQSPASQSPQAAPALGPPQPPIPQLTPPK